MDILGHPGISGLEGQPGISRELGRNPRLKAPVGTALRVEHGQMDSGIDCQVLPEAEIILGIERQFMTSVNLLRIREMQGRIHLHLAALHLPVDGGHPLGDEGMPGVFRTEFHQMAGRWIIVEVHPGAQVADSGMVVQVIAVRRLDTVLDLGFGGSGIHHHVVPVVRYGGVGEQFAVEYVVPPRGTHRVAPEHPHFSAVLVLNPLGNLAYGRGPFPFFIFVVHEAVPSVVSTEIEAVLVAESPGDFAVQVIEIIVGIGILEGIPDERPVKNCVHPTRAYRI